MPMKKVLSKSKTTTNKVAKGRKGFNASKALIAIAAFVFLPVLASAQSLSATGYEAGTSALDEVANQLVKYIPYVVNLCYALAGIFAIVGAVSVYIAMNNDEQDVKKKIMLTIGSCVFLIAAANALPLFFGITT